MECLKKNSMKVSYFKKATKLAMRKKMVSKDWEEKNKNC